MSALEIAMTKAEASSVTLQIRRHLEDLTETHDRLIQLVEQAKSGGVWEVLGFTSWAEYAAVEFAGALNGLERSLRVPIVAELSAAGLSQRTIATMTGTSVGTVNSDLKGARVQALNTCGTDGKTYPRKPLVNGAGVPTSTGVIAIGEAVPPVKTTPRRRPIADVHRDALAELEKAVNKLVKIHDDDRFEASRDKLAPGFVRPFEEIDRMVHCLARDLRGEHACDRCGERLPFDWVDAGWWTCADCRSES